MCLLLLLLLLSFRCMLLLCCCCHCHYVCCCCWSDPTLHPLLPLQDALDMALRLVLSIPMSDILAFRKVSRAYFSLMEVLAHSHTSTVAAQV